MEQIDAFLSAVAATLQDVAGLLGGKCVVDVAELDGGEDLFRLEFGEESPKRLPFRARIEVPDRVDQSARREMNNALFRTEPTELAVVGQLATESSHVCCNRFKCSVFDESREVLKRKDTQLVATAEGEGQTVTLQSVVCLEDAVCGRIVGIFVDCVRADVAPGGRKAEIYDTNVGNDGLTHFWSTSSHYSMAPVPRYSTERDYGLVTTYHWAQN